MFKIFYLINFLEYYLALTLLIKNSIESVLAKTDLNLWSSTNATKWLLSVQIIDKKVKKQDGQRHFLAL